MSGVVLEDEEITDLAVACVSSRAGRSNRLERVQILALSRGR